MDPWGVFSQTSWGGMASVKFLVNFFAILFELIRVGSKFSAADYVQIDE